MLPVALVNAEIVHVQSQCPSDFSLEMTNLGAALLSRVESCRSRALGFCMLPRSMPLGQPKK